MAGPAGPLRLYAWGYHEELRDLVDATRCFRKRLGRGKVLDLE